MSPSTQPQHNVLVVDDDPDIRDALVTVLGDEGYGVVALANGAEALAYLRSLAPQDQPCVIFLDLMMPVMDGWEFRRQQLVDPALAELVVVAISAGSVIASSVPVRVLLPKPLEIEQLLSVLHEHC